MEIWEEWWHGSLVVITAVLLFTEGAVFKRVGPSSVVLLPMRIELVKFVGGEWGDTEEGFEEDFQVFVIVREDGVGGEWCE